MKTLTGFKLIGVSILLVTGISACDKPGPAETAGKKIDETTEKAAIKIGDVADKVTEKLDEQGKKSSISINDAEITAKVKASIFAEPGLKTLQISVDTVNGVVTLSGSVDSLANSDRAKALASAVAGVQSVDNHLALKPVN